MDTSDLIKKLSEQGVAPPAPHPLKQAALWIVGTLIFMAVIAGIEGLRSDLSIVGTSWPFLLEILVLLALGISATIVSFYHTRPDGVTRPYVNYLPFVFITLWLIVAAFTPANTISPYSWQRALHPSALLCPCHIIYITAIPVYVLFYTFRMGATIHQRRTGGMGMLGVTTFSYIFMRFVEPTDDLIHLLLWHALPVAMLCLLAAYVSKRLLRW